MAVNNIIKRIQNIMRQDAGINGDAQRIEQMTWMFFLKVYDTQEETWEYKDENYKSIIPEDLRWRKWAVDEPLSSPLNLEMERGQKIVLTGANGIGKSTLLKSILGLIKPLSDRKSVV